MFHQDWFMTFINGEFFYKVKKMNLNPFRLRKKQSLGLLFQGQHANCQYFVTAVP